MSLNALSKTVITDKVDVNDLPEQLGEIRPMFQPGPVRFRLSKLGDANFDVVNSPEYGERAKVKFDQNSPLQIIQAMDKDIVGLPFQTTITNVPRKRGKGDDAPVASDWDYLNHALGIKLPNRSNYQYAQSLIEKAATGTAEFNADFECSWRCREDQNIRVVADDGSLQEQAQLGCGSRFYQKDVPKVDGKFPERITCTCGASIRGFANLTRFRA